jgi:hypothetical protein
VCGVREGSFQTRYDQTKPGAPSIIQGPFSVAPRQTLISRFATFASLYPAASPLSSAAGSRLRQSPLRRHACSAANCCVPNRGIRGLARRDRKWPLNDGQIQNPSNTFGIVPLSRFVPRGFGCVHHSIALLYHQVPNPCLTIRNLFRRCTVQAEAAAAAAAAEAPRPAIIITPRTAELARQLYTPRTLDALDSALTPRTAANYLRHVSASR